MDRTGRRHRRAVSHPLRAEYLEDRRLMSAAKMVSALEVNPVAFAAVHPNTPVMPFATPTKKASFIDPTVSIENGNSVVISFQSYVAPMRRSTRKMGARSRSAMARTSWTAPASSRIQVMRTGRPRYWSATMYRSGPGRRSWVPA